MTKNDEKILELREVIQSKKDSLGSAVRFIPETNCSLEFRGYRYNLHTLGRSDVQMLLVELHALEMSAGDLEIDQDKLFVGAYSLSVWMEDLRAKLAYLEYKCEADRLRTLEKQLEELLSDEKQTELTIEEIAKIL